MTRKLALLLLALGTSTLGACVAGMAASAVGMAVQGSHKPPQSNELLQPKARSECSAQASQYGAVHVIDVQQYSTAKIIVWGTVDDGTRKLSFQCDYGTKITGFRLRPIKPIE